MAILMAVCFKQPDRDKLAKNPRCKNPATLGPTPRTVHVMRGVSEHVVEQMRRGNTNLREVDEIRRVLRQRGYKGRVQIQLHRSPKRRYNLTKYRCPAKGIGPEPILEMWL